MNKSSSFFILGESSLTAQCIEYLLDRQHFISGLISEDSWLQEWAKQHQIPLFNHFDSLPEFDYLLSIVNPKLIPEKVIQSAKTLAINYHDSPLPVYAGVHATSWAILNNEKSHGITWHIITEKIDAGDILKQHIFAIDEAETAFSLNIKCYQHALQSFKELIIEIEEGRCVPKKQDLNNRSYFGSHKKPPHAGAIIWDKEGKEIKTLFRALDFGNYPNRFCLPKLFVKGQILFPNTIEILATSSELVPGTVLKVTATELQVATKTFDVLLTLKTIELQKAPIEKGNCLAFPHDLQKLEDLYSEFSSYERFWVQELQRSNYLNINQYSASTSNSFDRIIDLPKDISKAAVLTAVLIYFYRISQQSSFTVNYQNTPCDAWAEEFKELFISDLPFNVSFTSQDTFKTAQEKIASSLKLLDSKKNYSKDLPLRYPTLKEKFPMQSEVIVQFVNQINNNQLPEKYELGIFISEEEHKCRLISSKNFDFLSYISEYLPSLLEKGKPQSFISSVPILSQGEEEKILRWGDGGTINDYSACIHELIEAQALKNPSATALVCDEKSLSYEELNHKACELSLYLRSIGIEPETNVAICIEKSFELVIAILAVMKAGGAFIPLDTSYPKKRLHYILKDAKASFILTQSHLEKKFEHTSVSLLFLDQPLEKNTSTNNQTIHRSCQFSNRVYIIYTSGSTGVPKGVEVEHRNLAFALRAKALQHPVKYLKFLWVGSINFDISIANILLPLIQGGTLFFSAKIPNTDSDGIVGLLNRYKINHFGPPVSLYSVILKQNKKISCPTLEYVCVGGEVLTDAIVSLHQKYFPQAVLYNEYGPTECTILSSYSKVYDPTKSTSPFVSIGKPVEGTKIYILDSSFQLLPPGIKGEICIGGAGVARGYLNNPKLTEEKFILNSFGRLYKTADLGYWLPQGEIQFAGRTDHQVKFRGYRIELEEIEKIISRFQDIRQAAVALKDNGQRLVGYLVLETNCISLNEKKLRSHLNSHIPAYMIPSDFVILDKFPLTMNGKIDRKKLPEPSRKRVSTSDYKPPQTFNEKLVAKAWSHILKIEKIGKSDCFFSLGGHSLSAVQVIVLLQNSLGIEISLKTLYEYPILEQLAELITNLKVSNTLNSIEPYPEIIPDPSNRSVEFSLTDIQQAYWLGRNKVFTLSQIAVHGYSEYDCTHLDLDRLEKSWNLLIQRHEALRLIFPGEGKQKILSEVPFYSIQCFDFSDKTEESTQEHLTKLRSRLSHQVLPLDGWPLFEICVTKMKNKYRLHFSIDGLIVDGWSFNILLSEWDKLYSDLGTTLPSLEVSFRDYVLTETQLKQSSLYTRDKNYWLSKISDFPIGPPLPLAKHPREIKKPNFGRCSRQLPKLFWDSLKEKITAKGLTPTAFLLALFAEVLQYWSNSSRFTITLTLFNRLPLHPQINDIIGDFTSLTLCEIDNREKASFLDRAKRIQARLFSDLDHRLFSGIEMLRELGKQNQSSWDSPLMPVVFTSLLSEESQDNKADFIANQVYSITQTPQVWLDYKAYNQSSNLVIEWDYVRELFPDNLIEAMHQAYFGLLERLAQSYTAWEQPFFDLFPATQKICRDQINTTTWETPFSLLHELFHNKANTLPNHTAVIYEENSISYKELQAASNQLGRHLRRKGAKPNCLVAIIMDKGIEQVLACLGILNSGSAYLPISPDFPEERIGELLRLGEANFILTQDKYAKKIQMLLQTQNLESKCLVVLDGAQANEWKKESGECLELVQTLDDLAYVIFTSGSTGVPKGVMIDHRGAVNTILDINDQFKIGQNDRILAISNLNFDLSVYDIFGLLASGGTIVIPKSEDIKDPSRWIKLLKSHRITIWNSVPMFMSMLTEYLNGRGEYSLSNIDLRLILLSGDWIPLDLPSLIKDLFFRSKIISLGGATEASIWSIAYPIKKISPERKSISYGFPLRNQEMYVLNDHLQPSPDWVQGDIYIGGIGLAKGYWKDKEKTAAQFIVHPEWKKSLYKTGDLGRYYPDGSIEFVGRSDSQVKINGHRVELGEIQKTLESHKNISNALVTVSGEKNTEKQLIAYLVLENNQAPETQSAEIQDPLERMNFKLSNKNLREFPKEHANIQLNIPEIECSTLFQRKSYRRYDGSTLQSSVLSHVLQKSFKISETVGNKDDQSIPLSEFERFLSPLIAYSFPEHPVPKYAYPSAGGLYPIQTYIKVRNVVGIDPGLYYLNQIEKKLYLVDDENLNYDSEDHFTIYLKGKEAAIKPLYGDLWKEFCQLEIGYISHLLNTLATTHNFQISAEHVNADEPLTILRTTWVNTTQIQSLSIDIELIIYVKPDSLIGLNKGWYHFEPNSGKLTLINNSVSFVPQLDNTDYYSILMESPFILFFINKNKDYTKRVQAGLLAQYLMENGLAKQIGFCPIGTLDSACSLQYKEIVGDQALLHILAAGPISQEQLQERRGSIPKDPEMRFSKDLQIFLKDTLPNYCVPSSFVVLEKFPLSVNGKVDRKSLPLPQSGHSASKHYIPPRTDIEKKLAAIWSDVLKVEGIGIQDHFFHLGGHSLSAVQVISRLRKIFSLDLSIKVIFEHPILESLAVQIAKASEKTSELAYPPIVKVPREQLHPLSFTQQRLWFLDQLLDNKVVYNIPLAFRITGSLSAEKLKHALNQLIESHEILRTIFYSEMGIAKQCVLGTNCFDLPIFDLSKEASPLVDNHIQEEATTPFDLSKGPLIRGRVLKIDEIQHVFLLTIHHIITDEWSIRILLKELSSLYHSPPDTSKIQFSFPSIQYIDFASWQRSWLKDRVLEKQLDFWKGELENCTDLLQLPTDKPRPQKPTYRGAIYIHTISSEVTDLLRKAAEQQKATLFMFLLGSFQIFLHRYSGQKDIITGFPVANRHYPGVENLMGYFANTVVLRTIFYPEASFKDIIKHIKNRATKIYENQDVPFEYLVDYLKVARDLSRHPLFQVMFVYRDSNLNELSFKELEIEELAVSYRAAKFDLTLTIEEGLNEIKLEFEYAIDLFEESTIQRMAQNFIKLLKSIIANPEQQIGLLELVEDQERNKIINEWNQTEFFLTPPVCLHQLFEKQAAENPAHTALVFDDKTLSYEELNKKSNQLANHLRKLNISSDSIVGIGLERSIELVVSIYSIMKAGGAYLPLELSHPKNRLKYMMEDANIKVILTLEKDLDKFSEFKGAILLLDQLKVDEDEENLNIDYPLSSLAYVIYTSGSTGQPKGVCIEHKGLTNRIAWMQHEYQLMPGDKVIQKTSFSFDVSVWEFFWPLAYGATLVIAKPDIQRNTEELIQTIQHYSITCIHFVPSMFGSFLELQGGKKCPSLRMVFASGEALSPHYVKEFFEQTAADLYNLYGPTETSIDVTYWDCHNASLTTSIPIGKPIWNTETYILDKHLNQVPIGVSGELYLSGVGLARCYLNKPALTAEKFLELPFTRNKKAYRTGDLARYLPDGSIEFLGRLDHQVKVRGYRIELEEIERILGAHAEVFQCIVDVFVEKTGHKSLVAYVALRTPNDRAQLRNYLSERLPDYMIPSIFIPVKQFPSNTSGKIDRKALLQTELIHHRNTRSTVLPRNELEADLVQVWKDVLQIENISVTDNFFELGGDSILSIQIVAIAKRYGYLLHLADLFSFPTIEKLAPKIRNYESIEPANKYIPFSLINPKDKILLDSSTFEDAYPLASLQAGMIYHNELNSHAAIYQDTFSYEIDGELKEDMLSSILESKISVHPVLRTSFNFNDYSEPLQLVHHKGIFSIEFKDISHLNLDAQNELIEKWFAQEKEKRFTLSLPTLIRFTVHKRSKRDFQLGLSFHHAILDGWSIATLISDIIEEYEAKVEDTIFFIRQPGLSYGAYIQHEKQVANSPEQFEFWEKKLEGFHQLEIYDNFEQNNCITEEFSDSIVFEKALVEKIYELAKRLNVPLKSVLLAAYLRVLSRISGESDITTGYILNGRLEELDGENTLGLFLNTVPLRVNLAGGTWEELVKLIYEEEKQLLPFRWYPLAQIQNQHKAVEIFNTSFNYAHFHIYDKLKDNKHIRLTSNKAYEKTNFIFSANFYIDPIQNDLCLSLEYDTNKISHKKIKYIFEYFENALKSLAYKSDTLYQYDSLLSESELNTLLSTWNDTEKPSNGKSSVLDLFKEQVKKYPNCIAAIFQDNSISYQQLDARSDQIAYSLRKLDHSPFVALSVERSIELIIGIIGILKARKGFIPLDPNYPKGRLDYIFKNSNVQIILTQSKLHSKFEKFDRKIVDIETLLQNNPERTENNRKILKANDIAYTLYTSGSTGMPKGVVVEHSALLNQIQWLQSIYCLTELDKVLHHSSLAFDVSIEEIFWPLCSGATMVIAPKDIHQDIDEFINLIERTKVTILDLVPSLLEVILQHPQLQRLQSIRQVLVGGEILHSSLVKKFYKNLSASLHNMYGLTETTITSTYHPCIPDDISNSIPIGHPIWNTKVYILDKHLCLLPIGVPGEICISGQGLARSYLNQDELTRQKFIPNPFNKETLLFKTGDLGCYRSDGSIEFLGRSDNQIKLHGQRIELEEIENILRKHPTIHQSVVEVQKDRDKSIISYLILKGSAPLNAEKLKNWLREWVPESWIPTTIISLEQFPLLPSGKIDRKAFPKPTLLQKERMLPSTPLQEALAQIWKEILQIEEVGINENFFALGGNSLSMTIAAMHIRKKFDENIPLRMFLENPTIAHLANLLGEQREQSSSSFEEISLPSSITPQYNQISPSIITHVLLTGATGFLGAHLLSDLLENSKANIFCLVRAKDRKEAENRLLQNLYRYFPKFELPKDRVIALPGDLSRPSLGLNDQDYQLISQKSEIIYHCGASVHHVYDYKTLMAPNVLSVIEMLKLAINDPLKKVVYISTLSIAEEKLGEIQEEFITEDPPLTLTGGYEQTKWMAEKLLAEASKRGIPVQIFRPSTIIGHSITGISSYENDHLLRLLKGCIQMEKSPDWDLTLDMLPVDFISNLIIKVSLDKNNKNKVFNLSNCQKISWLDIIRCLKSFGYKIEIIPYSEWKSVLSTTNSDNALFPLLSLYIGEEINMGEVKISKINTRNTLDALTGLGINMLSMDDRILNTMISYLSRIFFTPKKEFSNET